MKPRHVIPLFVFLVLTLILACSETDRSGVENPTLTQNPGIDSADVIQSGGPKVDSQCNDSGECTDRDREDNTIAPGTAEIVWINNESCNSNACNDSSGTIQCSGADFYYEIYDKGNNIIGSGCLCGEEPCSNDPQAIDNYDKFLFDAPAAPGFTSNSVTMTIFCGGNSSAPVVGSDGFRLVNNGNCFK